MNKDEIESYRKAGQIAGEVVAYAKGFIKPGMLLLEIAEKIDEKIGGLGGAAAFPVNLSLNEVAAHYTPSAGDETKAEGLLKIDLGVAVEGYIADVAFSLDLTEEGKYKEMIEINEQILESALENLDGDSVAGDVGRAIQDSLEKSGKDYKIIRNLSGHSLGRNLIHAGLTISNYRNENQTPLKGMAFAIEPFLTTGVGEIY